MMVQDKPLRWWLHYLLQHSISLSHTGEYECSCGRTWHR